MGRQEINKRSKGSDESGRSIEEFRMSEQTEIESSRLEIHKKSIGKPVIVIDRDRQWQGEIMGVKDKETFLVRHPKLNVEFEVNLFNIRYL